MLWAFDIHFTIPEVQYQRQDNPEYVWGTNRAAASTAETRTGELCDDGEAEAGQCKGKA